jgi:hypothetical protein
LTAGSKGTSYSRPFGLLHGLENGGCRLSAI